MHNEKGGYIYQEIILNLTLFLISVRFVYRQLIILCRYEDAYKALLNWLEETEEMMANQSDPSADAKVW